MKYKFLHCVIYDGKSMEKVQRQSSWTVEGETRGAKTCTYPLGRYGGDIRMVFQSKS